MIRARRIPGQQHAVQTLGRHPLFQGEADLDRDLPMRHLAVDDMAPRFRDGKPLDVAHRLVGLRNGAGHGRFDAFGGRTGQFELFVDVIVHGVAPVKTHSKVHATGRQQLKCLIPPSIEGVATMATGTVQVHCRLLGRRCRSVEENA